MREGCCWSHYWNIDTFIVFKWNTGFVSAFHAVCLLSLLPPPLYYSPFNLPSLSFLSFFFFSPFLTMPLLVCIFSISYSTFPISFIAPPRYHSLLDRAEERRRRLLQRYNEFLLAYEAGDMLDWIREKKAENTGVELDDVWELQKKFDEFQTVRKRNLLFQTAFWGWHGFLLFHMKS